jgi:ribosomal protein L14
LGQNKKAVVGDAVVIAVKSILLNRKVTHNRRRKIGRGMVKRAIVIRVAYQRLRKYNMFIKGSTNAVAILGN